MKTRKIASIITIVFLILGAVAITTTAFEITEPVNGAVYAGDVCDHDVVRDSSTDVKYECDDDSRGGSCCDLLKNDPPTDPLPEQYCFNVLDPAPTVIEVAVYGKIGTPAGGILGSVQFNTLTDLGVTKTADNVNYTFFSTANVGVDTTQYCFKVQNWNGPKAAGLSFAAFSISPVPEAITTIAIVTALAPALAYGLVRRRRNQD